MEATLADERGIVFVDDAERAARRADAAARARVGGDGAHVGAGLELFVGAVSLDGGLGQTASARQALAQLSAEALRCGNVRVVGAAGSHAGRQRVLADERARRHHVEPALA